MSDIKEIRKVYNWLAKTGVDLSSFEPTNYIKHDNILCRSFKGNAESVKRRHNYKFNIQRDVDAGWLSLYERMNKLIFEKNENN